MKEYAGKILIIVQNLPVPFDRRVWLEAKTLTRKGYKVSVICPKSSEYKLSYEKQQGVSIYRYALPGNASGLAGYVFEFIYAWLATALLSIKVHLREGFDVIHACNPPDTYFLLGFIYKWFGKKFVFDHHDLSPEMYLAKFQNPKRSLYFLLVFLERLTMRTADVVISTNNSYKRFAIERGKKKEADVFVVRTGPDESRLHVVKPQRELKRGKDYLVCYLGEMCPQDGVDYLLKIADILINGLGRDDVAFTLIGGGPALPRLKQLCKTLHLEKHVKFTGRIPDDDLNSYLSTADICVDPDPLSCWSNHSTMNKVMEYMVFARPIVAFDLMETRNTCQSAALYAKPNDMVEFAHYLYLLLDNPGMRSKMGEAGYHRVHLFLSWRRSQQNLIKAYRRIFNQTARALQNKKNGYTVSTPAFPVRIIDSGSAEKSKVVVDVLHN